MAKRTSITDADQVDAADDLEHVVRDKREAWRAGGAKARRRQRRYKKLLTRHLVRGGAVDSFDEDDDGMPI